MGRVKKKKIQTTVFTSIGGVSLTTIIILRQLLLGELRPFNRRRRRVVCGRCRIYNNIIYSFQNITTLAMPTTLSMDFIGFSYFYFFIIYIMTL